MKFLNFNEKSLKFLISKKTVLIGILALFLISGCAQKAAETTEEYCIYAETGEKMSLTEAKSIAMNSDCVTEGGLTEKYMCNEVTGTWWIDLDIYKEGCAPACVISVGRKTAEINWRCTGLVME